MWKCQSYPIQISALLPTNLFNEWIANSEGHRLGMWAYARKVFSFYLYEGGDCRGVLEWDESSHTKRTGIGVSREMAKDINKWAVLHKQPLALVVRRFFQHYFLTQEKDYGRD